MSLLRALARYPQPVLRWAGVLLFSGQALTAGAARPSYEATMEFGRALLADYEKQHGNALAERLDGDALFRATFEPLGREAIESDQLRQVWRDNLLPAARNDFQVLDSLPIMVLGRVQLLDGKRALECVFTNDKGLFQMLVLRLDAHPDGKVVITDLQRLGQSLEASRRLRHTFLMMGAPNTPGLDTEEQEIRWASADCQMSVGQGLRDLGSGKADLAFDVWNRLPDGLKATRIWQEFRDTMAYAGSKCAQADVQQAYRQGRLANGVLRLEQARKSGDQDALQAAWDALLRDAYEPSFLLIAKAGDLLESGRVQEAFALARRTYELQPRASSAYLIAIQAACKMGNVPEAMTTAQDWALAGRKEAIDGLLRTDPRYAALVKSAAYHAWLAEGEAKKP